MSASIVAAMLMTAVSSVVNQFAGAVVNFFSGGTATANATFQSDGTCTGSGVTSVITNTLTGQNWFAGAPVTGIGAGYWILVTPISGTLTTNDAAAWASLASAKTFSVSSTTVKSCTARVDISNSAGGAILATGNVSLTADSS